MSNRLDVILKHKKDEINSRPERYWREQKAQALDALPCRGFLPTVQKHVHLQGYSVIAEMKPASPSQGRLRENYVPSAIAKSYEKAGVSCLSVLTDQHFFQGDLQHLHAARIATTLPILRKDFLLDARQIDESRAIGADCVLLIMAALSDPETQDMAARATELGLDILLEVHDRGELERAIRLRTPLLGINNRNLKTFDIDLETTLGLLVDIPEDRTVVTESGIRTQNDVLRMLKHEVRVFLIGEQFMRAPDPGAAYKALFAGV